VNFLLLVVGFFLLLRGGVQAGHRTAHKWSAEYFFIFEAGGAIVGEFRLEKRVFGYLLLLFTLDLRIAHSLRSAEDTKMDNVLIVFWFVKRRRIDIFEQSYAMLLQLSNVHTSNYTPRNLPTHTFTMACLPSPRPAQSHPRP
jgi:hypothetical protein